MKNRVLLHRTGRNQFGDYGDAPLPEYVPSPAEEERAKRMVDEHRRLNDDFVARYREPWLHLFADKKSKKEAWAVACPYGTPALSTFRTKARAFPSFDAFLLYWLVHNKRMSLRLLGHDPTSIDKELRIFDECGRYFVTYGASTDAFGSM